MVRLTRLKIDRFRNVKPGTDLRFGPTFNVLLGKNATGKSTLLDLIAAVTNDDLSGFADEEAGFDLTWWLEQEDVQLEMHAVRTPVQSPPLPEVVGAKKTLDERWRIDVRLQGRETDRIEVSAGRGVWTSIDGPPVSFDPRADLAGGLTAFRSLAGALNSGSLRAPAGARIQRALTCVGAPFGVGRFDEADKALDAITASPFQWTQQNGRGTGQFGRWIPGDLRLRVMEAGSSDLFAIHFESLESISEIPTLVGFASAELRPRVLQRSQSGKSSTTVYGGFDCLFRRPDGSQISHQLLSFGQKRLFSFLWYLAVRESHPVIADELLNGLHHEWIEICLARLHDRQSFLATHDPLLLDHIPIESAAAVQTTFVRCSLEADADGHEQMAWRNFTEEESDRFFIAYQTGIQHVSEVLRSEGLW